MIRTASRILAGPACAVLLAVSAANAQAPAKGPSAEDIVRSLTCQPGQDCAEPAPTGGRKRGFGGKRSFTFEPATEQGRSEIEQRAKAGKLPSTDVEVTFDFDSDVVGPAAQQALAALGAALNHPQLAGSRFILIGHTDAKGSDAYNQALSERRAASVKRYLGQTFGIAPDRLDTYGRGKTQLKNAASPLAAENRRVQVINQGAVVGGR